jgi:hypothetical protein
MTRFYDATAVTISEVDNDLAIDVIAKGADRILITATDAQLHGLAILIQATLEQRPGKSPDQQQSNG